MADSVTSSSTTAASTAPGQQQKSRGQITTTKCLSTAKVTTNVTTTKCQSTAISSKCCPHGKGTKGSSDPDQERRANGDGDGEHRRAHGDGDGEHRKENGDGDGEHRRAHGDGDGEHTRENGDGEGDLQLRRENGGEEREEENGLKDQEGDVQRGTRTPSSSTSSNGSPGSWSCKNCSPGAVQALASGGGSMCLEQTLPGEDHPLGLEVIMESTQFLLSNSTHRPKIGIICGSGLGSLAGELEDRDEFPYELIPNFPVSTVKGHAGRMVLGLLAGVPVICMQGRFHAYEGYPLWKCAMPVRVMKLLGVVQVIVTNAAGGLNPAYNVGDIMVVKDHVNMQGFAGDSPLKGRNDERFGPRFPSMNNAYDRDLRALALLTARQMGLGDVVREGVYVMLGGPSYETVAELKLLRILDVDAVGMSTVPEVVVARHCGLKVFAFSLITNKCIMEYDTEAFANHEEVIACANSRQKDLQELVKRMVIKMVDM